MTTLQKACGLIVLCIAGAIALFVLSSRPKCSETLVCILDVKDHDDTTRALVTGYNYTLLKLFAEEKGYKVDILLSEEGENYVDSLSTTEDISIVVKPFPCENTVKWDSVFVSPPIDSLSTWLCSKKDRKLSRKIKSWVSHYPQKEYRDSLHLRYTDHFFNPYNLARRGVKREFLSPYDDLIRQYADSLGWDWRLLAALIYQESRFRIDARSHKNAAGLMQMIPSTANRFEIEDIICPEENIAAGTRYLQHIQYLFRRRCPNKDFLDKVTLAAYNAGENHIRDCFYFLSWSGLRSKTWEDILSIMPEMKKKETARLDTIKAGTFNVGQTMEYVERVMGYYEVFKKICPVTDNAQSSQDQSSQ